MTCKIFIAFEDGTVIEEEFPNHELADIQETAEDADKELFVKIEIEDCNEITTYTYRRKQTYAY